LQDVSKNSSYILHTLEKKENIES